MLKGKSLVEMAKTLTDLRENSKDFVVPSEQLKMEVQTEYKSPGMRGEEVNTPVLTFPEPNGGNGKKRALKPSGWAHQQIAGYTDIPRNYYERIAQENPHLLADNVNHGFRHAQEVARQEAKARGKSEKVKGRLVRTYREQARAFMSSSYRILDSYDLLETIMPVLIDRKFEVVSCELTERRTYIKAVTKRVTSEVKKGDVVQYGLCISSSDVGAGALRVEPLIYRLVCLNGMVMDSAIRKFHIGKDQVEGEAFELLTDETKLLSDQAFWAQVRDVVVGSMEDEVFQREVDKLRVAANEPIKNFDLPRVVELTAKAIGISSSEYNKNSIVAYLANGADGAGLTKWGLMNAVTWAAQQEHFEKRYDDSVDQERAAARLLELPRRDWERIAASPKD